MHIYTRRDDKGVTLVKLDAVGGQHLLTRDGRSQGFRSVAQLEDLVG